MVRRRSTPFLEPSSALSAALRRLRFLVAPLLFCAAFYPVVSGRLRAGVNSDTLYLTDIAWDMSGRSDLFFWILPAGPAFVPDVLVVWLLSTFFSDPVTILSAWIIVLFSACALTIEQFLARVADIRSAALVAWTIVLLPVTNAVYSGLPILLFPTVHQGTVPLVLFAPLLLHRYFRSPSPFLAVAMAVLFAVCAWSDLFFLMQVVFPLVLAGAAMSLAFPATRPLVVRLVRLVVAVLVLLAVLLWSVAHIRLFAYVDQAHVLRSTSFLRAAYSFLATVKSQWSWSLLAGAGVALWSLTCWRVFGADRYARADALEHFVRFANLFTLFSLALTIATPIVLGRWHGDIAVRYVWPVFFLPWSVAAFNCFHIGVRPAAFPPVVNRTILSACVLALLAAGLWAGIRQPAPDAAPIDRLLAKLSALRANNLITDAGIADYWVARRLRALSGQHFRVAPSRRDFSPELTVVNVADFLEAGPRRWQTPSYTFVVVNRRLSAETVRSSLGVPVREIKVNDASIWLYPTDRFETSAFSARRVLEHTRNAYAVDLSRRGRSH